MKQSVRTLSFAALCLLGGSVCATEKGQAAPGPVETFLEGCKKELDSYCKDVTPGEGRLLACIFAYDDKLSPQCEYALYDSAAQLEQAVAVLTHVASECDEDLQKHCANVEAGEGRLLACLEKNEKDVSERCHQALEDVGLEDQ